MECVIIVMGRNIHILIDRRKLDIRHTDLLALVYKRRSLLEQIADRKHRTACPVIPFISVSADDSWVVMVFQIQRIPCSSVQCFLPFAECMLQTSEVERTLHIFRKNAIGKHMIKMKHQIQ